MEGDHVDEFLTSLGSYDTVLMGTNTYEIGLKVGVTYPYPPLKHYVFSHSLDDIDELIVKLNPLLFGTGISLTAGTPGVITLDLLASKVYTTDVVLLTYRVNYAD